MRSFGLKCWSTGVEEAIIKLARLKNLAMRSAWKYSFGSQGVEDRRIIAELRSTCPNLQRVELSGFPETTPFTLGRKHKVRDQNVRTHRN